MDVFNFPQQRDQYNGSRNVQSNSQSNGSFGQVTGRVSFTIGDSSDCESVSTVTSGSVVTTPTQKYDSQDGVDTHPLNNADTNRFNDNPWHKFHFHNDLSGDHNVDRNDIKLNKRDDSDDDDDQEESEEKSLRGSGDQSLTTTTRLVPNSNYSLAQLSDSDFRDNRSGVIDTGAGLGSSTWGKWRILIGCAVVQLFSALMVSLQAPFYPAEAEKKGASATEYGFIFGVFELTVFIVAPFYGSRIHKWNPKLVFNLGIVTAALSSITFGILDKIDSGKYFVIASALVRVLEALGESALITASFVMVASAFSESVASTFALLETFYSIGLISGPIVGSLLYQFGGYSLPFMAVGGGLLAAAVVNFVILPSPKEISEYQCNEPILISSYKSFRLLGTFPVLVSAICIIIGAMSISYLQATLEPHLRQFNLSQLSVGAIIIINGAVYTITAPFWGVLCDKILQLKLVTFCGSALLVCGYSLVGPIPILPFQPSVWLIAIGLALQGIGLGAVLVASFVSILRSTITNGLPDSPSTYGLVSSLWTSMFSLGSFLGPSLSGILYDAVGFSNGTLVVIVFSLIMMCVLVLFVCISDAEMDSFIYTENEPLIASNSNAASETSLYSEHQHSSTSATHTKWAYQNRRRGSYGST